ncbi:AbrB/MazE/SpoVT family DNA-binding domain-containing protein [Candidatus Woesearchaeota archaeon]|nr:AbrB/MazE/SpoVT family DNA-binding domain-containing protein [Candidatus Woesearchaeota archaeon]
MDFRKIIAFGKTSYVISIPKTWIKKNNLKKGDMVGLSENENNMIISPGTDKTNASYEEKEINLDNLDRSSIVFAVRSAYRKGYDKVKLTFKNPMCHHFRLNTDKKVISIIHKELNRLAGFDIIQQKEDFCIIKSLTEPSIKEFDTVMRRIFLLMVDAAKELYEGVESNNLLLIETLEEKHNTITKFVSYCLRLLNKYHYPESGKTCFLYYTIGNMEKVTDVLKNSARILIKHKKKLHSDTIAILKTICDLIYVYYDLFYRFDSKKVLEFSRKKETIKNNILNLKTRPKEELFFINTMESLLELLQVMIEVRMSMGN